MDDNKSGDRVIRKRMSREESIAGAWRAIAEAKEDAKLGKTAPAPVIPKFEDDEPAMVDCVIKLDEGKQEVVIDVPCPYGDGFPTPSHVNQIRMAKEAWLKVIRKKWFGDELDPEVKKALFKGDIGTLRRLDARPRPWSPYEGMIVEAPDCRIYFQNALCLYCGHLLALHARIPDWVYKEMPPLRI